MRVAFVTLWDGPAFGKMEQLAAHNKRRYCAMHGFEYIVFESTMDKTRHTYWSKILAVQKVLPEYDWVVWHDTDALLWNDSVDIRCFTEAENVDFLVQEDRNGLNSGVFLVRNSPWSERFLTTVYEQTHLLDHPCPEQQAISELVCLSPWREKSRVLRYGEPQNELHGLYDSYEWDKLFVHFAGIGNEVRLPLVENLSRLAGYEKHLRVLSRGDFPELLTRLGLLGQGAEVGAGRGEFASLLLKHWNGKRLHLIDPWGLGGNRNSQSNESEEERRIAYRECVRRTVRWDSRVLMHRAFSEQAAMMFTERSLDFVRIDGDPSYEGTSRDIKIWWPKVKPGGLLLGNNYLDGKFNECTFGVRSAVLEFEQSNSVAVAVTAEWHWASWYVVKPSKTVPRAWHDGHPTASKAS